MRRRALREAIVFVSRVIRRRDTQCLELVIVGRRVCVLCLGKPGKGWQPDMWQAGMESGAHVVVNSALLHPLSWKLVLLIQISTM